MESTSIPVKPEGQEEEEVYYNRPSSEREMLQPDPPEIPEELPGESEQRRRRGRPSRQSGKRRTRPRLTLPRKATKRSYTDPDYVYEVEVGTEPELFKMEMRTSEERKLVPPKIIGVPPSRRFSFSLEEKLKIIEELEAGEKQAELCKRRGLPKSTVTSIWKNRENFRRCIEHLGVNRKRLRKAQNEELESVLINWMNDLKASNMPVNGSQLRARAKVVAKELGEETFRASVGWLDKFKARHKISFKKLSSKQTRRRCGVAATNRKLASDWIKKIWPNQVDGYSAENIFSVQESGLFFHTTPLKTAQLRTETCSNGKMSGERLSVLLCVNSDGSQKLKPVVVGNDPSPRSLHRITNQSNLPVSYFSSPKSWVNQEIFNDWLEQWNLKLEKSNRKIILTLSDSPCHTVPETEFSCIKITVLPSFFSKSSLPLERGVIAGFKRVYRRLLLEKLIRKSEQSDSRITFRAITILDSLVLINSAWGQVTPEVIHNAFFRSGIVRMGEESKIEDFQQSISEEKEAELDAKIVLQLKSAGISFPDITLKDYSHIDWGLYATDVPNSSGNDDVPNSARIKTEPDIQPIQEKPCKRDVQASIDTIRNWVMFSKSQCHESVHAALSVLENFVINHEEPEDVPETESETPDLQPLSDHVIIIHPPGSVLIDCNSGEIAEPQSNHVQAQIIHVPCQFLVNKAKI